MSVDVGTFLEKFKDVKIESAEIKIKNSSYYYIIQKNKEKADLYLDKEAEYPKEPVAEKEEKLIIPPDTAGVTQLNQAVGVFTLKKQETKGAELVKHLKSIEEIEEHIDFNNILEIIYEKKN